MSTTAITGAAGEHLVMSRLLSRGFTAALAPQFAPNIDIIVTSENGDLLKSVQVKTSRSSNNWRMTEKAESLHNEKLFYCLVFLASPPTEQETVYVVPSKLVAKLVRESHRTWLSGVKANGEPRKNSGIRALSRDFTKLFGPETEYGIDWLEKYREAWHLLELGPDGLS